VQLPYRARPLEAAERIISARRQRRVIASNEGLAHQKTEPRFALREILSEHLARTFSQNI
jgi:hypothetical protein